jgi:hypothetical protein
MTRSACVALMNARRRACTRATLSTVTEAFMRSVGAARRRGDLRACLSRKRAMIVGDGHSRPSAAVSCADGRMLSSSKGITAVTGEAARIRAASPATPSPPRSCTAAIEWRCHDPCGIARPLLHGGYRPRKLRQGLSALHRERRSDRSGAAGGTRGDTGPGGPRQAEGRTAAAHDPAPKQCTTGVRAPRSAAKSMILKVGAAGTELALTTEGGVLVEPTVR